MPTAITGCGTGGPEQPPRTQGGLIPRDPAIVRIRADCPRIVFAEFEHHSENARGDLLRDPPPLLIFSQVDHACPPLPVPTFAERLPPLSPMRAASSAPRGGERPRCPHGGRLGEARFGGQSAAVVRDESRLRTGLSAGPGYSAASASCSACVAVIASLSVGSVSSWSRRTHRREDG